MHQETVGIALSEFFEHTAIGQSVLPHHGRAAQVGVIFRSLATTVGQIDDKTLTIYAELWAGAPDRLAHQCQLHAQPLDCSDLPRRLSSSSLHRRADGRRACRAANQIRCEIKRG
jgi:hypothetical protein